MNLKKIKHQLNVDYVNNLQKLIKIKQKLYKLFVNNKNVKQDHKIYVLKNYNVDTFVKDIKMDHVYHV